MKKVKWLDGMYKGQVHAISEIDYQQYRKRVELIEDLGLKGWTKRTRRERKILNEIDSLRKKVKLLKKRLDDIKIKKMENRSQKTGREKCLKN